MTEFSDTDIGEMLYAAHASADSGFPSVGISPTHAVRILTDLLNKRAEVRKLTAELKEAKDTIKWHVNRAEMDIDRDGD